MYTCGLSMGYSAILLPQLESNETSIKVTESDSSWIASMTALSPILGVFLGMKVNSVLLTQNDLYQKCFRNLLYGQVWSEKMSFNPLCAFVLWMDLNISSK